MAAGPTQKSAQITNLDSTPVVLNNSGDSGPYRLNSYEGYATPAAADGVGTLYLLCRVKSTVKVKEVIFESEAQGAGKIDLGVYYADDVRYLAPGQAPNVGAVVSQNLFATDIDCASAVLCTNETNQSGNYTLDKRSQPLWQAAGLTSDPGGYFDIVASVHTTAITTGTGKLGVRVTVAENDA